MSDEGQGTINEAEVSSTPEMASSGDLVSTVEQRIPTIESGRTATETKTEEELAADAKQAKEAEEQAKQKTEEERLDKHPRFQQLISQNRELRDTVLEMKGKLDALGTRDSGHGAEEDDGETSSYQDVVQMGNDKIIDALAEDPLGFLANFGKQLHSETVSILENRIQQMIDTKLQGYDGQKQEEMLENKVASVYNSFAEKHSDFVDMWESGQIKQFMDENPGHNAISAYWELAGSEDSFNKKVEAAVKAKEQEILNSVKARGHVRTLGGGPAGPTKSDGVPAELKDSSKFGGPMAALVARHAARKAG
jgi:hypothetical protein